VGRSAQIGGEFFVSNMALALKYRLTSSILITNIGRVKVDKTGIPPLPISCQEVGGKGD
jgi:hypothetical protein